MENSIKHNINTDLFLCSTQILDISKMHFAAKQRISLKIWKLCYELFTCKEKTVIIYVCIFLSFLSSIIAHGKPIQVLTMSYLHYNNSQMCNRCKKKHFSARLPFLKSWHSIKCLYLNKTGFFWIKTKHRTVYNTTFKLIFSDGTLRHWHNKLL